MTGRKAQVLYVPPAVTAAFACCSVVESLSLKHARISAPLHPAFEAKSL